MTQENNTDIRPGRNVRRTAAILATIAAIYVALQYFGILDRVVPPRFADDGMGYWFPFVFGLTVSIHCVAVCGWINLSQCKSADHDETSDDANGAKPADRRFSFVRPSILYNAGRLTSYTVAGTVLGALGSILTISGEGRGMLIVKLIIGSLMIVMGVNLLGIFPQLNRFAPKAPKKLTTRAGAPAKRRITPYIVGLFNWLMPCGPLQAAHLYAFSTGSPLKGGLSMMLFVLGTIPLKFALGMFGSVSGEKTTRKIVVVGGVMVTVLGLCLLTQGIGVFGSR